MFIFSAILSFIEIALGSWSVSVILGWFGKDIPILAEILIGLLIGTITIPVSIAGIILKAFGVF